MTLLATSLLNTIDLVAFPAAIGIFYAIGRIIVRNESQSTQRFFMQGFWLRVWMLIVFTVLMEFYYKGDSYRYYVCILDIKKAISDGSISLWDLITTEKIDSYHPLYSYFAGDEMSENHYYMISKANFTVPKVGALFSLLFFDSYMAIGFCYSFFSLLGSLQLYKIFSRHFPVIKNQVALACFFIPTVCFWSSGILKDSLTFGALGFLFSTSYNLFVARKKILSSLLMASLAIYLLYVIKPYIMLAFAPSLMLLISTLWSSSSSSKGSRGLLFALMIIIGLTGGVLLYINLTSEGALERYNTELILDAIDKQRGVFENAAMLERSGSNYTLGTDNPILMFPLGIVASYFRPFPWEISSPIMMLNAVESLLCLLLVLYTFHKVGFFKTLRVIFSNPFTLFCVVFSLMFGAAVGTSTGNFGSLVRYKIPGMPFFLLLFFLVLHLKRIPLPARFRRFKLLQTS